MWKIVPRYILVSDKEYNYMVDHTMMSYMDNQQDK